MLTRACLHFLLPLLLFATSSFKVSFAFAQSVDDDAVPNIQLGEEYRDFKKTAKGGIPEEKDEGITARKVLLYIPNRLLDLVDVFKFDVGVGPSFGGVLRLSKYAQAGARAVSPISLRVGLRGRKLPVFVETSSEIGISPAFKQSHDRQVGSGEIGAGLDLVAVGLYAGVDLLGIADFFAGIFGFDPSEDDVR